MSQKLKFNRIRINRFPGFPPSKGFSLEGFCSGINVIYGPNASGKTTIAKVFHSLLWPEIAPSNCHVHGNFSTGGNRWYVENDEGTGTFERNGKEIERPSMVPPEELRDRYRLSLHHLIQEDTDNEGFAKIILREAAGGYDLSTVEDELDFRTRPSNAGQKTDRNVKNKLERLSKLRDEVKELDQLENSLPGLKERLEESKSAGKRARFIEDLLDYKNSKKRLLELKKKLESFPVIMEKVVGDEEKRLEEIDDRMGKIKEKREEAKKLINEARETLKEVGSSEGRIDPQLISETEEKIDQLEKLEDDYERISRDIAEAEGRKEKTLTKLSHEFPEQEAESPDSTGIDDLIEFARKSEEVRIRLESLTRIKSWLGEEEYEQELEDVRRGQRYLEEWLRARTPKGKTFTLRRVYLSFAGLHLAGGLLSGFLLDPFFFLLTLPSFIFGWSTWIQYGKATSAEEKKSSYIQLGLKKPEAWSEKSVRQRLRELGRVESSIQFARKKKEFLNTISEDLNGLKQKKENLELKKQKLVDQYGIAPDTDEAKLYWLIERINSWTKAEEELGGLTERKREIESSISDLQEELNNTLNPHGYDPAGDASEFRGYIRDLNKRRERSARAREKLETQLKRKEEAEETLSELREEKSGIFDKLGLKEGSRAKLFRYVEQLDEYRNIKSRVKNQKAVCQAKGSELKDREEFDEDLLDSEVSELEKDLSKLKRQAERQEEIIEEISTIKERIRQKKKGNKLEMARADLNRAFDQLKEQLVTDYEERVGNILLDYLREEGLRKSRPEVFSRANEFFTGVTRGSYRLEINEEAPPSFMAIDSESGRKKELRELSSGTRLQLLTSIRLAFIEEQEKDTKLPVIMDEVLANSDDVRASKLMDAALEMSRNGRQVFYLTAQGDEVAKWKKKLSGAEIEDKFMDLTRERELDETFQVPAWRELENQLESIPSPEGMSHREYGEKLEVPRFNPRLDPGSAHAWYLVEDPEVLYETLKEGIETWGQLKSLIIAREAITPRLSEVDLKKIRCLGIALEAYVEGWRAGRNRKVNRTVIKSSEAVTDNFFAEVMELVAKLDGDPEKLIKSLEEGEISGFRTDKKQELENYFLEEGYIDRKDKLDGEELKARMLRAVKNTEQSGCIRAVSRLYSRLRYEEKD